MPALTGVISSGYYFTRCDEGYTGPDDVERDVTPLAHIATPSGIVQMPTQSMRRRLDGAPMFLFSQRVEELMD
jgi:hypothetical protein